jgi:hypothetical protein
MGGYVLLVASQIFLGSLLLVNKMHTKENIVV